MWNSVCFYRFFASIICCSRAFFSLYRSIVRRLPFATISTYCSARFSSLSLSPHLTVLHSTFYSIVVFSEQTADQYSIIHLRRTYLNARLNPLIAFNDFIAAVVTASKSFWPFAYARAHTHTSTQHGNDTNQFPKSRRFKHAKYWQWNFRAAILDMLLCYCCNNVTIATTHSFMQFKQAKKTTKSTFCARWKRNIFNVNMNQPKR